MVEEKGLPGHVADRIGEFVVLRGQPLELLEKLSEAGGYLQYLPAVDHRVVVQERSCGLRLCKQR